MPERQRLPKLRDNNKLINFKTEINGINEELLKENETDITDVNHLIYAAETVIAEIISKPGKTVKNIRNKDSLRIQREISKWRKELSIIA
jgi:predicted PilT family ATPase